MESGRRFREPDCVLTKAYEEFILNDWDEYLARIEDGSLKPVGSEVVKEELPAKDD